MAECPTICEPDLNLTTSIQVSDFTRAFDEKCNEHLRLVDCAGLQDAGDLASDPWMTADSRVRFIASMDDIREHFDPTDEIYAAARLYFNQGGATGVASGFYIGFWDSSAESIIEAVDAIEDCFSCWTHFTMPKVRKDGTSLVDHPDILLVGEWVEARCRTFHFTTCDEENLDITSTAHIAAQAAELSLDHTFAYYSKKQCRIVRDPETGEIVLDESGEQQTEEWLPCYDMLAAGYMAGQDFTQSGQQYSFGLKPLGGNGWTGIRPEGLTQGEVTQITGTRSDGTLDPTKTGIANVYVSNKGYPSMWQGRSVTGKAHDHVHLSICVKNAVCAAIARFKANSRCNPYDPVGQALLVAVVKQTLQGFYDRGYFERVPNRYPPIDNTRATGPNNAGFRIDQDGFENQSDARRFARVAPLLTYCYMPVSCNMHTPIEQCIGAIPNAAFLEAA